MYGGEKFLVGLITVILVIAGIVTIRSQIHYGSPFAVFGISIPEKKQKETETEPVIPTTYAKTTETVNLRPAPNSNNTPIKVIQTGQIVNVISIDDGWANIIDSEGIEGYVANRFLSHY